MPSKPRSLAGILHRRRAADAEYNRAHRDAACARVYASYRWQRVRLQVLRDEPCCRSCASQGRSELATQVDHVVPLVVDISRAFDPTNLQPLCSMHHAQKSAAERSAKVAAKPSGVGGASNSSTSAALSGARGVSKNSRVPGVS
jgi:5-methylcytosine-specific restriction protein A